MKTKLKAILGILFNKYTIVAKEGNEVLIYTNMNSKDLRKASCMFFNEAHSLL